MTAQPLTVVGPEGKDVLSRCQRHRHEHVCRLCGARRACCLPECASIAAGLCSGACSGRQTNLRPSSRRRFADASGDPYLALMRRVR